MKIKLVSPRMSLRPMDSEFKRRMSPSLALLTLASLTPPQHHIIIQDENINKLNLDDRPDLVGITVNVDTSKRAYKIASIIALKLPLPSCKAFNPIIVASGAIPITPQSLSIAAIIPATCVA